MSRLKRRWRTTFAIQQRARELRRQMTPAERLLWRHLCRKQLGGLRFRRQHPIDRFIVDFYCAEHRLAVEIDGDVHAAQTEYDKARTEWLEARGCRVIRFTNQEVRQQLPAVLEAIYTACSGPIPDEEQAD
jgi:very-short-patch-repair endonuclease